MAAPNLGWLADLVSHLLYIGGQAVASRRAWNFSTKFTATDDAANRWTDIDIDSEALADETTTTPVAISNNTESIGTASTGLARADHAHRFGVDPANDGDSAVTLAYDASAVGGGETAIGLLVDEETSTSGTSVLLRLQRLGNTRFEFRGSGSGPAAVLSSSDNLQCTVDNRVFDLVPSGTTGDINRRMFSGQIPSITASGTETFTLPTIATSFGGVYTIEFRVIGKVTTPSAPTHAFCRALVMNVGGTVTVEDFDVVDQDGTNVDTITCTVSASDAIELNVTNNHSATRLYRILAEVYR